MRSTAMVMAFALAAIARGEAAQQSAFTEESGTLPDGTIYLMRVPPNWNRVLIRDLDYASGANHPRAAYLLERGYALAGTRRHRLRIFQYDPAREIANLDRVLDRFEARFGKPARVIQYGCSGGGHVALAIAEHFADRVDGVVATAAHTPVWIMNTYLDGWFTLKALIAPDLVITGLPTDQQYGSSGHGMEGPIVVSWRQAINAAQQTPEGRARIALAFTLGQWPAWVNRLTPEPDLDDPTALQHSMYHAIYQNASNPGGEARILFESAAQGQQLSWNTGVDYAEWFENGNEWFKRAVRHLYQEAGLDLSADLARVNAFPRVAADSHALAFWKAPGRNVTGRPRIPVFRMQEIGDYQVPPSLVEGYSAEIRANGMEELYRDAFVRATGHCGFSVAESAAAIETLMRRIDSGRWDRTAPEDLNRLAGSLHNSPARFVSFEPYRQARYNRVWAPK